MEIDHREKSLIKQLLYSYEKKVQSFYYFSRDFFLFFKSFSRCYGLWVQLTTLQMATGIKAFTS